MGDYFITADTINKTEANISDLANFSTFHHQVTACKFLLDN